MSKILIGVVLYETNLEQFEKFIKSIAWQTTGKYEILIAMRANDNRNYKIYTDSAREIISHLPNIKFYDIQTGNNIGFGAAHNILCDMAATESCDLYIGANPDGMFHHKALLELMDKKNIHQRNTLFELRQFPQEHPKDYDCLLHETQWCSGACFAIDPKFFLELGGFDSNFFMYCEDVDLSWRIRASGGRCILVPNALFLHDLSDDRARLDVKFQMLRSGRYLGWKWWNDAFVESMQREINSLGISDSMQPSLRSSENRVSFCQEMIDKVCVFHPPFLFSSARW